MALIQQRCPGCDRSLQLPEDSIGKKARCPACQITFEVLAPPDRLPADVVASPSPRQPEVPVSHRYNPLLSNPEASSAEPERSSSADMSANPYQATGQQAKIVHLSGFEIREVGFGEVLEVSWEVFKQRWGYVIVSALITLIAATVIIVGGFMVFGVLAALLGVTADAGGQAMGIVVGLVMLIGMLFSFFAFFIVSAWLWTAWSGMLIAIAQGHPNPTAKFVPNWTVTQNVILSTSVLLVAATAVLVVLGFGSAILANAGLAEAVGVLMAILGLFVYTFGQATAQFFMWPWLFTLADQKATAVGSLRSGLMLAMHNKANSLLLVICHLVLGFVGVLLIFIGLLVTLPFARLLSTVTYLMTTNQDVLGAPRVVAE